MSNKKEEQQKITFLDKVVKLVDGSTIMGRLILNPERDNENFIYIITPIELTANPDGTGWFWRIWSPFSKSVVHTIPVSNLICVSDPKDDVLEEYVEHILNKDQEDEIHEDEDLFDQFELVSNSVH